VLLFDRAYWLLLSSGNQTTYGDHTKGLLGSNLSFHVFLRRTFEILRSHYEPRYERTAQRIHAISRELVYHVHLLK
jgi:hypothetical protein